VQLRAEQLEAHLAKGLRPIYTVHGDEPLLALEASDAVRAAARRHGCTEREVLHVDRSFDWSALAHAGASQSLFGGARIVELRMPTGKPGTQGAAAIEKYCEKDPGGNVTLVTVPRLDKATQSSGWFSALAAEGVIVDIWPVDRARLPQWIAGRLARNHQSAEATVLEFLADRVEGNLLAAHQEVQKLALLLPAGELALDEVEAVVANVARYNAHDASAALLAGDLGRYLRVLGGLRGEGEAPSLVLWTVAEDLRALDAIQHGMDGGRALDGLLREQRVWGSRQPALKSAIGRYAQPQLEAALAGAAQVDRAIKGVAFGEPWDRLARLGLELVHGTRRSA